MEKKKVCRRVNGQIICEEKPQQTSSGGLFGSSSPAQPQPPPRTYTQPQPVRPSNAGQNNGSNLMTVAIPPKELIEITQFGKVRDVKCKRDQKTGHLRCKVITD